MGPRVLSAELVAFLESGGGVLVGAVDADGQPCSSRGWGLHVTDPATGAIRLIIDADDPELLADLGGGGAIAVTVSDIRTLRSVQLKGRVAAIEPMTAIDRALARQHVDTFFGAVTAPSAGERPHRGRASGRTPRGR